MADSSRQSTTPRPAWVRFCQWLWSQRGFLWGTVIVGLALNLLASWLLTPFGTTFSQTPLEALLGHPLLLAAGGLGLLGLTGSLWLINHFHPVLPSQKVSTRPLTEVKRQAVVRLLRQEYGKRLAQSLQGSAMMMLGLHERTDAIYSSAQLVFRRIDIVHETPLPSGTTILQAYNTAGQGLLILGAPGAGKTTLLLDLAEALLTRAESDPTHPIAVILNLSSWASKKTPLASWLIDQLRLVYGIPSHLGQTLLEQDHWLLLLDGLDEVAASTRSACIEAINLYRAEHFVPLVVCSRSHEYLSHEDRLALSSAVEIQPLREQEVTEYLKCRGRPMAAVRAALRTNLILKELLTTPLMLNVVILTYRDKALKELSQLSSAQDQQRQIFAKYVERMLSQRTDKSLWIPHQTQLWLSWLAKQMKRQAVTEFYLEHLQPNWLPSLELRFIYNVITALLAGILVGPVFGVLTGAVTGLFTKSPLGLGLLAGLIAGLLFGTSQHRPVEIIGWKWRHIRESTFSLIIMGVFTGLFAGLVVGVLTGLFDGGLVLILVVLLAGLKEYHPLETISWKWRHVRKNVVSLLLIELLIGPSVGLLIGLFVKPFVGLLAGIFAEVFMGLSVGFSSDQLDPEEIIIPNYSIQRARHTGFLFALPAGLLGGLFVGVFTGVLFDVLTGVLTGLFFGLLVGLFFGLGAVFHQQKLLVFLRCLGAIPKDYVRFLDYAAESILLYKVGGGYSFIHQSLVVAHMRMLLARSKL